MRKLPRLLVSAIGFLFIGSVDPSHAQSATPLYIQVAKTKLRSAPQLLAPAVADLAFGDSLEETSREGSWIQVQRELNGQRLVGYVHESVITPKKIILTKDQTSIADVAVDQSNVYLAGKGFNESATKTFDKQNPAADLSKVDDIQSRPQPEIRVLQTFLAEASLKEEL